MKSLFSLPALFSFIVLFYGCSNNVHIPEKATIDSEENSSPFIAEIEDESIRQDSIQDLRFKIPDSYILFEKVEGDLNKDGIPDHVLMIKGTDSANVVINRFDDVVDRNRRGLLIYLSEGSNFILATKNLSCFYSENEDGGNYFPPELSMSVHDNKLYFDYAHGRYGFWQYTFRYQDSDFAMIGYDASHNFGPIVKREVSINFLTKKRLTRENLNQDDEDSGNEVFEEIWEDIEQDNLFMLSDIREFEDLDIKF